MVLRGGVRGGVAWWCCVVVLKGGVRVAVHGGWMVVLRGVVA